VVIVEDLKFRFARLRSWTESLRAQRYRVRAQTFATLRYVSLVRERIADGRAARRGAR